MSRAASLVLAAWGLGFLAGCSDAPIMQLRPTNRVVLAEIFTWMRCGYCPYAARALDSVAADFPDSMVVVAYHRRVAGDTLSPPYSETRMGVYYSSGGEPATSFDGGNVVRTSGPSDNYPTFHAMALAAKNVVPEAQLSVSATADDSSGTVTVRATGVTATPTDTLRLFVVLTEDSVRAYLSGETDSVFRHLMRQMLPGVDGDSVNLTAGDTVVKEYDFQVQPFWNRSRLGVVAFVQDIETREVLQTAYLNNIETKEKLR
ncbi:MAG TPA: Omp28-related outer membrane protein [bacterium]|nr:Omp28-related outer membrane protein [bacterium]